MVAERNAREHADDVARAKPLSRVSDQQNAVTAPAHSAAQVLRSAIEAAGNPSQEAIVLSAGLAAQSRNKVSAWLAGSCSPNLDYLMHWAQHMPRLWCAVRDRIDRLCVPTHHIPADPLDRLGQLAIEVGHVAQESTLARADGHWDAAEIARVRREAQHLRDVADLIDRDLDALAAKI